MTQRFFFDLVEDERTICDEAGVELATPADIRDEAERCAAWIAAGYHEGRYPATARIRVRDSAGTLHLELPIRPLGVSFTVN